MLHSVKLAAQEFYVLCPSLIIIFIVGDEQTDIRIGFSDDLDVYSWVLVIPM